MAMWRDGSERSVKPSAQPTLVRTQHLPPLADDTVRRPVTADLLISERDRLATVRGYPAVLHWDNSPEPACQATADWAGERAGLS